MDKTTENGRSSGRQPSPAASNKADYLERLQGLVDGMKQSERRATAQSALDQVAKDLGFHVAKTQIQPVQDQDRGFEREP